MLHLLVPDARVESVLDLDVGRLRRMGLEALLVDVDGTLKNYRAESLRPGVRAWLESLVQAGFRVCLLSNGLSPRIGRLAAGLGLPFVSQACKPLPFGCRRAMRRLKADGPRTAVVGDQLFADVLAARLAGLRSILVRPFRPEEEPWFTRIKRPLERLVLRRARAS